MPGQYLGPTSATVPAILTEEGVWEFALPLGERREISFGDSTGLYIAGADYDGDGTDDLLFQSHLCKRGKPSLKVLYSPLSSPREGVVRSKRSSRYFSSYLDSDGDGRDEYCSAVPYKKRGRLQKRFFLECLDLGSGKRAKIALGRLFARPLPLKGSSSEQDFIVLQRPLKDGIRVSVRSTHGTVLAQRTFSGEGTLVVGRFLSLSHSGEQIGFVTGDRIDLFDPFTGETTSKTVLPGVPVDEVNINHFQYDKEGCECTSRSIRRNGSCRFRRVKSTPTPEGNDSLEGACSISREIRDGSGNWLHKPVSDSTGSVVNLFHPSDVASSCRYESQSGEEFQKMYFTGNSNPDRPTWRPERGGSCKSFPKPLVVSCLISGVKNCWNIPDPCVRYD